MAIDMVQDDVNVTFEAGTTIKVVGVGGGGGNAVAHMMQTNVGGIEFIFANTDAQDLSKRADCSVIQLGDSGQGAGSKPDVGKQLTQEAEDKIRDSLAGAHLAFITAGMGGGTGTGGAPVIARIAREMGILTVAVVTKPFEFEGSLRMQHADKGLQELESNVDALIVVLNDKLAEVLGDDITLESAYEHANDILKNAVRGISDIINVKGQMNVDFADVKTVMSSPGKALMGIASAEGPDRAATAAKEAISCPLLEGVDLKQAKGLLVVISAARNKLKLSETKAVMEILKASASDDPSTTIKFGTVYDDSLGDKLSVTVVATGLSTLGAEAALPLTLVHLKTGTGGAYDIPTLHSEVSSGMQQQAASSGVSIFGRGSIAESELGSSVPAIIRKVRGNTGFDLGSAGSADTKVNALFSSGMTDTEIPAYLCKQAD